MTTINNPLSTISSNASTSIVKDSYLDQNALNSVKAMGRKNDPQALKEISKKFEGIFVQQMLKSMRDANEVFAKGNELSSSEVKFHQDMLDQQMVLNLTSGKGIGLATSMYQQMIKSYGKSQDADLKKTDISIKPSLEINSVLPALNSDPAVKKIDATDSHKKVSNEKSVLKTAEEFVEKLKPYALKAAEMLNIKADVLLAQAALETGWGKSLIHDKQGNSSFNIFNIKATGGWQGKSVTVNTLEYENGVTKQEKSGFRHYDDLLQSFNDYVNLIKNNPRYEKALAAGDDSIEYAKALQQAGYATDPHYADKIKQILKSDVIRSAVNIDSDDSTLNSTLKG